jgi:hypothetical protein
VGGDLVAYPRRGAGQGQFLRPGEGPVPVDSHRPRAQRRDRSGILRADGGTLIGHDVTIGRYLTPETIRLGLVGVAAGSVVGLAWRVAGRARWGPVPFVLAVLLAAYYAGRSDWPRWDAMAAFGAVVILLAGAGAARLLADPAVQWPWLAAGSLGSAAGVWAGVPETGPAVLAGAALGGLAVSAALTRARWAPTAGLGIAVAVGWAALSGAAGRPWAMVGGALCTGVAPWFALHPLLPTASRTWTPGPWLLGAHAAAVMLAARWIGAAPHPGWLRVAAVTAVGVAVAAGTRRRA